MKMRGKIGSVCLATAGLALVGCGGSDSTPTPTPAPAPAPPPPSITVAGTAVQGAALGGAAVSVKCVTGTGAATTSANGAYTVTITEGALPCVVKAVGTNGTTYHSLVAGTGNTGTFTANASPLTEMVVSHIAGMDPATFFNAFGSTSAVASSSVTAANAYMETALAAVADLSGVNPLNDALVVGNGLDQKIDAVVAWLTAAGIKVTDVTAAIVQNPTAPSVVASAAAPSAADCAWLKSGNYRFVSRTETDPKYRFEKVQIDAKALTAKGADGIAFPMTSDGACQFDLSDAKYTSKLIVSPGGLLFYQDQSKTQASDRHLLIGVPEQTLPITELAGTWNLATWLPGNIPVAGGVVAANAEVTLDSTGQITASKGCIGLFPCVSTTPPLDKFVVNPAGGFDVLDGGSGAVIGRSFPYKTLAGRKVALNLRSDNTLFIGVPMTPIALPAVGTVTKFRQFQLNGDNSVSELTEDMVAVTATDVNAKTATRILSSNSRVDTITYDKPRDGLRYRAGNSCMINNAPVTCAEIVQLRLQGIGVTMTLSAAPKPSQQFYQFSIDKP